MLYVVFVHRDMLCLQLVSFFSRSSKRQFGFVGGSSYFITCIICSDFLCTDSDYQPLLEWQMCSWCVDTILPNERKFSVLSLE